VSALEPITGAIVSRPHAPSVRDVDPARWDQEAACELAVSIWLSAQKSTHTKAAYRRDAGYWLAWCRASGVPVNDARRADVDAWRNGLEATGHSPATVGRKLAVVSSFYDYYLAEDMVERNPAKNAKRPAVSAEPVSIALTRAQASALLAYADSIAGRDPRPAIIIRLLAETGMRVSELTGARVEDLGMSSGHHTLSVVRKGGKRQALAIATTTSARLGEYLSGRTEGWILHVQRTERRTGDGQMDRGYVRQVLRRVAREAGLPREVHTRMHPHVLRHSVVTLLAADGIPVHEIQRLVGHSDLRTTQRYIHHLAGLDGSPTYAMARILAPAEADRA
jgi:integrase/recombinase XerD